jgi:hypothetical protein
MRDENEKDIDIEGMPRVFNPQRDTAKTAKKRLSKSTDLLGRS